MKRIAMLAVALTLVVTGSAVAQERPEDVNAAHQNSPFTQVIAGADRYETAAQVALNSFPAGETQVLFIANGDTLVDALVVGVSSYNNKMLLVRRDSIPEPTRDALGQIQAWKIVFLGGDDVISPEVREEVTSLVGTWR